TRHRPLLRGVGPAWEGSAHQPGANELGGLTRDFVLTQGWRSWALPPCLRPLPLHALDFGRRDSAETGFKDGAQQKTLAHAAPPRTVCESDQKCPRKHESCGEAVSCAFAQAIPRLPHGAGRHYPRL